MKSQPEVCEGNCSNDLNVDHTDFIVVTGGPGAGKTALLEILKKILCKHIVVIPEAASIVFNGGFWRLPNPTAKEAAQRAIFHVQTEMENLVRGEKKWNLALCDRGSLDGLAYWPGDEASFWRQVQSDINSEYQKYRAVIHLRSPSQNQGYNHVNPLRTETPVEAKAIDDKIAAIWSNHSQYHVVEADSSFLKKTQAAIKHIAQNLPERCKDGVKMYLNGNHFSG